MSPGELVYVQGMRGPAPEMWPHDAPSGVAVGKTILARRPLDQSEWPLSLNELMRRYPPPRGQR